MIEIKATIVDTKKLLIVSKNTFEEIESFMRKYFKRIIADGIEVLDSDVENEKKYIFNLK